MNEIEKKEITKKSMVFREKAWYLEKLKTKYKELDIPLGQYLLEKEFERQKFAENHTEKQKMNKTKSIKDK